MPNSARQSQTDTKEPTRDIAALLRDGRPDWEAITFDVLCGRCGYNFRMLTEPRCPECGLEFDWFTVLDESAGRSEFLFEHNWRKRPLGAWWQTVRRGLRPRRFWQQVSIHDRIYARPLPRCLRS